MTKVPINPDVARQSTLEGESNGPLRAKVRDVVDDRDRRRWLWAAVRRYAMWFTAVGVAVAMARDAVTAVLKWLAAGGAS